MKRCNDYQTRLMDHLYGLLDAAESAAVEMHLASCPACATAQAQARRALGLFAQAAKSEFPQVHFAVPLDPPVEPRPNTTRKAKREWSGWVVAATIAAMVPVAVISLAGLKDRSAGARRELESAATHMAEAKSVYAWARDNVEHSPQLAAARKERDAALADWTAAEKAEKERTVAVDVRKPVTLHPGAPAEFVVAVADTANSMTGSRIEARVRDQANAVLFSQKIDVKRPTPVRLPAAAWSKLAPDSEVFLEVAAVNETTGERTALVEPMRLFGPVYATMLVTDKATYHPGDRLFFRSLTLDRITFKPPTREQNFHYSLRKKESSAKPLATLIGSTHVVAATEGGATPVRNHTGKPIHGVGCGAFTLPADLVDGDYILTLTELNGPGGTPPLMAFPVTRTIKVRSGAPERFAKKISFAAPSFAPGSPVRGTVELKLGDKPIEGARGTVVVASDEIDRPLTILVDPQATDAKGMKIAYTGITDKNGQLKITFPLPPTLARGDVKLMVTFEHDGVRESVADRVPVTGKDIVVEFFPEGGKLLAGVPNRVYVRGTKPDGKPVDIRGTVAAGTGIVAKVDTPTHDEPGAPRGLGSITFTPKAGVAYRLRLLNGPGGIPPAFDLPKIEADGVALTALDSVAKPGMPIRVRVQSVGKDRKLVIGAYTRGRLADTQTAAVKAGAAEIVTLLAKADTRGGVTRITVFEEPPDDSPLVPVAERLVFRMPGEVLKLTASAGLPGAIFAPGSAIDLSVAATDEKGNPVPAILWAAAVNSAVAPDARERSLPTHFLLAGEVQTPDELEYADFLLTDHPKAAEALDLVLATQGWRRFVEQGRVPVLRDGPVASLLKLHGQHLPRAKGGNMLAQRFWPRVEESVSAVDAAQQDQQAAEPMVQTLFAKYEMSRRQTAAFSEHVQRVAEAVDRYRGRVGIGSGIMTILAAMLGMVTLVRGKAMSVAAPYFLGAVAAGGLTAYLAMGRGEQMAFAID
ncbi:MAG TPA: zf-HC2 domain-containing protein, partial [Urbifossiella sp.]|nr:zf-HC2 domain-containing protein [Urbifossiella sp.]